MSLWFQLKKLLKKCYVGIFKVGDYAMVAPTPILQNFTSGKLFGATSFFENQVAECQIFDRHFTEFQMFERAKV
jgi:hypothetical protein